MKQNVIIILATIIGLALVLGYAVPSIVISDGVETFIGDKRVAAIDALDLTKTHLSTPSIYILYTTKLKVISVEPTKSEKAESRGCRYDSIVQMYGYFGIPRAKILVGGCGGVGTI